MEKKGQKVTVVVVTYNRKELLAECLEAICRQTYPVKQIILVDNASTDGTKEFLSEIGYLDMENFHYLHMEKNLGGAGGFYEGIKIAESIGAEWVWVMDDDTIPETDCLEKLLGAMGKINGKVSFLASAVKGIHGEPMNVPEVDRRPSVNGYSDWYQFLADGIVKIDVATFVSLLISHKAIEKCGLPCSSYFIWGDDFEYTKRLTRYYGPAYFVGESKVCHKRAGGRALSLKTETDSLRIDNYYYMYRNGLINTLFYEKKSRVILEVLYKVVFAFSCLKIPRGMKKFWIVMKGTFSGVFTYHIYKKYILSQIQRKI